MRVAGGDSVRISIEQIVAAALEVDPADVAAIPGTAPLKGLMVNDFGLDSLDLLVIIVELEHHLRCQIDLVPYDAEVDATWSDFLDYVERCATAGPSGHEA